MEQSEQPQQWGVISGVFWGFVAFFVPQLALLPFIDFFRSLPIDRNAKLFMLQGLAELATVLVLWLVVRYVYHARFRSIGLGRVRPSLFGWSLVAFPLYMIASIIASGVFAALFSINLEQQQNVGYSNPNGLELALTFVALVVLVPFVEELLFRGFLFSAFRRAFGFWLGAVGVSALFAVAHGQANVGVDVFVLSMFLCYLREKTQSLWPSIALHALKNLVAFTLLFIIKVN